MENSTTSLSVLLGENNICYGLESGIKTDLYIITVLFEGEFRKIFLFSQDGASEKGYFRIFVIFHIRDGPNILCTTLISALLLSKIRKLDSYCLIRKCL